MAQQWTGSHANNDRLLSAVLHGFAASDLPHCARRPDFAEGIRALLIDKNQPPRWQPPTLAQITPEWTDGFFASPWKAHEHPLADLDAASAS